MISISCLESKLLNNNNWYGRFQLAPFQKGEGLTVANALRRTLLAEKSNFFITWVDFYNAEIPYSVLTGMRESIFDILLNLKQVIFTSDKIMPNSSDFLKTPSIKNFRAQKASSTRCFTSLNSEWNREKKSNLEPKINFSQEHGLKSIPNHISNQAKRRNQNFMIDPLIHDEISRDFKTQNVFCQASPVVSLQPKRWSGTQNQILGKINNAEDEKSSLVPLKIFHKSSGLGDQFLDISNSKKSNSTYIGYICAKGPAIIYAKNIKLPKGLKCVDPHKYIVTLADDGLFYLRFALTTEIKTSPLVDTSTIPISINQGIKFNMVRLKTFPKILFNKEMQSCFSFRVGLSMLNREKKSKRSDQHLKNNQIHFFDNYFKQKYPLLSFRQNTNLNEKKIRFGSSTELYDSKIGSVNHTKNLIKEQRLLLTNDSIKQFNFQNTSVIANIQKTCLLNIQIKHYYYKCGRFDRFLFDLMKLFKPILKSNYYNESSFKNSFYQGTNWRIFTNFHRTFEYSKSNSQVSIDYKPYLLRNPFLNTETNSKLLAFNLKDHLFSFSNMRRVCVEDFQQKSSKIYKPNNLKPCLFQESLVQTTRPYFLNKKIRMPLKYDSLNQKPIFKSFLKKKHLIDKLSHVFGSKINSNGFSHKLQSPFLNLHIFKDYSPKNKYFGSSLLKWQKIFKSLKTTSIYDYLQQLGTSEAAVINFLPTTAQRISLLSLKFLSTIDHQTYLKLSRNSDLWMSKLHEPYIEKFLNICFSFQCSKNNILCFLKSYILQDNNSSDFLNKNSIRIKNTLPSLLFRSGSIHTEKLITKIKLLRQWSFLPIEHSKGTEISLLKKKIRLFPFVNDLFLVKQLKLLKFLFSMKKNERPKHDKDLRNFYYLKRWSIAKKSGLTSTVDTLEELNNSLDISEYRLASISKRDETQKSAYGFVSQAPPAISRPVLSLREKTKSVFSLRKKTKAVFSLRKKTKAAKQWGKTQKSINKSWISSTEHQSLKKIHLSTTTNLRAKPLISIRQVSYKSLWTLPYQFQQNKNRLPSLLGNETNQNILVDSSYLGRDNTRTTFDPITKNNDVVLKPIYLNIEQIIYILKQTTKFHKNQRINPVFFNSSSRLNDVNSKKNYTNKAKHSHIWVLNSDFVFKNNSSHITLKNDLPKHHFSYCSRLFSVPRNFAFNFSKQSMYFKYAFNEIMQRKLIIPSYFYPLQATWKSKVNDLGNEPYNINIYNSKISFNLRYIFPFKYTIFKTFLPFINFSEKPWYSSKKTNSDFLTLVFSNKFEKMNPFMFKALPLNIKETDQKKDFGFDNSIQSSDSFAFFKNKNSQALPAVSRPVFLLREKTKSAKRWGKTQAINDNREDTRVLNSKIVFHPNFDYIQYNESFKIYTNLAYTCLKIDEPRLSKYRNFNRRKNQKSQVGSFQPERRTPSWLLVAKKALRHVFVKQTHSYLPINKIPLLRDNNQPFKFLIQNKRPYEKNNKNGIFSTKYGKLYHEKPSAYSFLMLTYQTKKTNGFLFSNQKLVTTLNQKNMYWQMANLKKFADYRLKNKFLTKYFRESKNFIDKLFKLPDFQAIKAIKLKSLSIEQNIMYKLISKISTTFFVDHSYRFDNLQLPSVFNNAYKWRIMNNPNFNDAFIVIPCTFYMDSVFQNTSQVMFLNSFKKTKQIINNKLDWSITYNTRNELTWLGLFRKKNIKFRVGRKNYDENSYNSKTSSFLVAKSNMKTSLKKLAISFENIYYKNFLWNSRKITLRILNNAVLPLVANRKYSISDFRSKKNYPANSFINMSMPIIAPFSLVCCKHVCNTQPLKFSASFVFNSKQKKRPFFNVLNQNAWSYKNFDNLVSKNKKTINRFTKDWLPELSFPNQFLEIYDYQKSPFYSIRQKTLGTTNFMCSKTYPMVINENQTQRIFKPNYSASRPDFEISPKAYSQKTQTQTLSNSLQKYDSYLPDLTSDWQTQQSDDFFFKSFSSLRSKWRPFFTGSLRHFQEKNSSSKLESVQFASLKQSENNEKYLLSYNHQVTPEKLTSLRKQKWTESLIQGSKGSNPEDISSKNNFKMKSPLISNLWSSSFFCSYSLYAILTKSDLFLQNLIEVSRANSRAYDNDSLTPNNNDIRVFGANLRDYQKNLEEPFILKKMQSQYEESDADEFLDIKPSIRSLYDKTIQALPAVSRPIFSLREKIKSAKRWGGTQKILKSQNHQSVNYFVPSYYYHWQKAVYFAMIRRFKNNDQRKITRFHWSKNKYNKQYFSQYPKKNIDYVNQYFINVPKSKYWFRRLKKNEQYFGNPLRRRISKKWLNFYNIILPVKLYEEFKTRKFKKNIHVIKSWKSIILTAEADIYFCFRYPLFIKNCNLPWQKSKYVFAISKHWLNRITVYLKSSFKLTYLPKTVNINKRLNTGLLMTYTQLSSSSNKTHQTLLHNKVFKNNTLPVQMQTQNQGSYGMVGYFTIKESLNSIYKVNYIVESHGESKSISELTFHSDQNDKVIRASNSIENTQTIKRFEDIQRDSVNTDSLTVSNFLNGTYSFVPSKTIILSSFNELVNSQINKFETENENEYIQIDIWTNGELSPRQALLNAFRKLFELFYNLSKYNCLKPIEI